jgi:hypothetical protein
LIFSNIDLTTSYTGKVTHMSEIPGSPDCMPVIVFGAESPTYPDWMFGLLPAKKDYLTLSGSAIVIGAAYLSVDAGSTGKTRLAPADFIRDVSIGQVFAERVVQALVKTDERVIIQRSGQPRLDSNLLESMRHAGFDVIGGEENAVFVGTGSQLAQVRWLQGVYDYDDALLISSGSPMSKLEKALVETARSGGDLRKVGSDFYQRFFWQPQLVDSELDGYSLVARPAGLQGEYLVVNRREADISNLDSLMLRIVSDLGIALYRADDIKQSSAVSDPFGQNPGHADLIPPVVKLS